MLLLSQLRFSSVSTFWLSYLAPGVVLLR